MERVDIICIGTLKEKSMRDICAEYVKRLGRFCRVSITELSESRLPECPSQAEISRALEIERAAMQKACPHDAFKVAMCIEGKQQSSTEFAKTLENGMLRSGKTAFIIGSSYGMSASLKAECDIKLSMSAMTFPHQLARCMLLEQIYRAYKIRYGETYHK